MNRIISFIAFICLIIVLLFVEPPGVLAAESSDSAGSIPQATNYTAISAVDGFMLALKDNGTVGAWGDNEYGQCTVPAGLSGVKAVAAGYRHTVALKEDGTVVAWGYNGYGQCTVPAGLSGVKAVAAGGTHTVALKEDGTVIAWGSNCYGECTVPAGLSGVKAVTAGYNHTVALKEDGTVVAWGDNGECTVPAGLSGVKAIAAGGYHTVALKEDGTVVAWGRNNGYGECTVPAGLSGVKTVAAGEYRTVALKEDGTVVAWGYNYYGQRTVPAGLSEVKAIAVTDESIVLLKEDGTIISFGDHANCIIPSTKASSANSLTSSEAEFNTSSPESITVKMYAEGSNKLVAVKNGASPLTSKDYNISGSAVTINKNYLSSCFDSSDKLSLTFDFDNGVDPVLSIEKNDSTKNSIYKSISAGDDFTLALRKDGTVTAWGEYTHGQCNVPEGLSGVKAVAAGYYHPVALREDGTVVEWGYNYDYQCDVPAGLTGVKAVAAGINHMVALKEDGTIVAWGDNTYLQCAAPAGLYGVKDIASGANFTAALKTDGTVVVWGSNGSGQCNVPANLSGVKSINAGGSHMVALKEDGTVVAWGGNESGQCNIPSGLSGVKTIVAGDYYTVALKEDGTLITWGYNRDGQCSVPAGLSGVKAIAAKGRSTVALKDDGTIISFGDRNYIIPSSKPLLANSITPYISEFDTSNPSDIAIKIYTNGNKLISIKNGSDPLSASDYSASGSAVTINKSYLSSCFTNTSKPLLTFDFDNGNDPVLTIEKADVSAQNFKAVAVGLYHTVALKGDGTITAWGDNESGQCNVPEGLSGVKAVAAGYYHTVALKEDGTVVAWGSNYYGQCNVPEGLSGVKAIAAKYFYTVALREDGTVVAWGYNYDCQCDVPAGLSGVKAVATSNYHSVALKEDGTVIAWGYTNYGQCTIPSGLSGVKAIAAGDYYTVALKEDGTVAAWGYNKYGQCNVPSGLSDVKAISADESHTMALKEDGTVIAWGDNDYDLCKNFNSLTNVKAISTGHYHSIALKENGSLFTWGNNKHGECTIPLGAGIKAISEGHDDTVHNTVALKEDGTVIVWGDNSKQCNIPEGLSSVKAVAVSGYHTVALKEDGTVAAWGDNYQGQCNVPLGLSGVKAVAAGRGHTVALKEDGTVVAWGNNDNGQCDVPAGLSGVKAVAAGGSHTVVLNEDGTVVAWGYNAYGLCNVPEGLSGVKAIAAGVRHTVALKEDGTVVVWGYNGDGQCNVPEGLSGVKAISADDHCTVALKEDGTIISWGDYRAPTGASEVKAISGTTVLKEDGAVINLRDNYIIPFPKAASTNLINPSFEGFDPSIPLDVRIDIDAGAGKLVTIKNGTEALTSSDYTVSGSVVIISKNYLASVLTKNAPLGQKISLTFDFDNGNDPVLTIQKIFIGIPVITIDPMKITVGKSNDVMITVKSHGYPVAGGTIDIGNYIKGQVLDGNGQAKVAVMPSTFGDILVTAYDKNHSLLTSKTVKAVTDSAISPDVTTCNIIAPEAIKVTMTLNGNTLVNILNGSVALTKYDYSVDGNVVTISKSYLSYYFGKYDDRYNCTLTFKFSSGKDATLVIKPIIQDATISPDITTCSVSSPEAIKVTMTLNGNTLVNILNGSAALTKYDYSVDGNVVTISKSYLSYYFGKYGNRYNCTLTFKFSRGKDATLVIKPIIQDATISPDVTTCSVSSPEAIKVNMTLNGNTLVNIFAGSAALTKYDYSVDGNVVTISKSYLSYYFGKYGNRYNCTLTFKFSRGKDATLVIKPIIQDATISPDVTTCSVTTPEAIKVTMTLNGNTLVNILNGSAALNGYDYSVDGNVVTISKSYLSYYFGKYGDGYNCTLTFKFSNGKDAVLTVKPML